MNHSRSPIFFPVFPFSRTFLDLVSPAMDKDSLTHSQLLTLWRLAASGGEEWLREMGVKPTKAERKRLIDLGLVEDATEKDAETNRSLLQLKLTAKGWKALSPLPRGVAETNPRTGELLEVLLEALLHRLSEIERTPENLLRVGHLDTPETESPESPGDKDASSAEEVPGEDEAGPAPGREADKPDETIDEPEAVAGAEEGETGAERDVPQIDEAPVAVDAETVPGGENEDLPEEGDPDSTDDEGADGLRQGEPDNAVEAFHALPERPPGEPEVPSSLADAALQRTCMEAAEGGKKKEIPLPQLRTWVNLSRYDFNDALMRMIQSGKLALHPGNTRIGDAVSESKACVVVTPENENLRP